MAEQKTPNQAVQAKPDQANDKSKTEIKPLPGAESKNSKELDEYIKKHRYDNLTFTQKLKKFFSKEKVKREMTEEEKKKQAQKNREEQETLSLAKLLIKKKSKSKKHISQYEHIKTLKNFLEKSGTSIEKGIITVKRLFITAVILNILLTMYFLTMSMMRRESIGFMIAQFILFWPFMLIALSIIFVLFFFVIIDFKIYNRKKAIEAVLPDYLQLTSANVSAGMPIDQALWLAVRPRFGVLAKEIEEVAKSTLSGEDLKVALKTFADKYESFTLKRSMSILIEGIESGGKIGPLLDKIAVNIQENNLFKKEMAANVTTYVIFITFASIVAAPFLFALSNQLLGIITNIMKNIDIPQEAMSGGMGINLSGDVISQQDFLIFIVFALMITSIFSAMIISIIKKGNVKDGLMSIPVFIGVSLAIFWIANLILGLFFGGIA